MPPNKDNLSNTAGLEAAVLSVATAISNANASAVWTAWTPTITAGSGTFTTATGAGRWTRIGNTIVYKLDVTITTVGTGNGCVFTLPVTAFSTTGLIGSAREDATTGNMGVVKLNTSAVQASVARYDNGNIASGGSGSVIRCCGTYEAGV